MDLAVPGWVFFVPLVVGALGLCNYARRLPTSCIRAHPHFSGATLSQFLSGAAQAGIFSFSSTLELGIIGDFRRRPPRRVLSCYLQDGFEQTKGV